MATSDVLQMLRPTLLQLPSIVPVALSLGQWQNPRRQRKLMIGVDV